MCRGKGCAITVVGPRITTCVLLFLLGAGSGCRTLRFKSIRYCFSNRSSLLLWSIFRVEISKGPLAQGRSVLLEDKVEARIACDIPRIYAACRRNGHSETRRLLVCVLSAVNMWRSRKAFASMNAHMHFETRRLSERYRRNKTMCVIITFKDIMNDDKLGSHY